MGGRAGRSVYGANSSHRRLTRLVCLGGSVGRCFGVDVGVIVRWFVDHRGHAKAGGSRKEKLRKSAG